MPHTLIVGASGTGKTTLAKQIAELRNTSRTWQHNFVQVALDPLKTQWPKGVFVVDNWQDFEIELELMHENNEVGCVYIDEANLHFGHSEKEKLWVMLRGRHFGLDITLITQFPTLLSPAARGQCGRVCVFRVGNQAAAMLAEDYAASELRAASGLKKGEYFSIFEETDGSFQVYTGNCFTQKAIDTPKS